MSGVGAGRPLDAERSRALGRTVLDLARTSAERMPAYHSLNVRADRRFTVRGTNLVAYISVWKAYDRTNIVSYYWNTARNSIDTTRQWGRLPVFGLEWLF